MRWLFIVILLTNLIASAQEYDPMVTLQQVRQDRIEYWKKNEPPSFKSKYHQPMPSYHDMNISMLQSYHPILGLLQKETYMEVSQMNDSRLVQIVDQSTVAILRTPEGKKICKAYTDGNPNLLQLKLGLGIWGVEQAKEACGWNMLSSLFSRNKHVPNTTLHNSPTKYLFVFLNKGHEVFEGWTSGETQYTTIGISETMTVESLLRVFIHEIYQTVDKKGSTVFRDDFKEKYTGEHFCAARAAALNPYIRMAFSAIRSYQVEDLILHQLGRGPNPIPSPLSCSDKLKVLIPHMHFFMPLIELEQQAIEQVLLASCPVTSQSFSLDETLKILETEKVTSRGKSETLCDYFSKPDYAYEAKVDWPLSRGPRPNIGDGSGIKRLQTLRSESFQRNEQKRIPPEELINEYNSKNKRLSLKAIEDQVPSYLNRTQSLKEEERP